MTTEGANDGRIADLLAENKRKTDGELAVMLGPVPAWVPAPITGAACRVAGSLLADRADPLAVRRQIDDIRSGNDSLLVTAALPLDYIRRVYELASFVYGVSLGEVAGLRALAGEQAVHGQKFKPGRKPGTFGPVRKAVDRLLKERPGMTTPALWQAIKRNPPNGWQAIYDSKGECLEGPDREVHYPAFENTCTEARKGIKITG